MPRIFISYRREDSRATAGRIYDRLVEAFGSRNVFIDVEDIPAGEDFRRYMTEWVSTCDVVLAIIGPRWAAITDESGARRLDNPADYVRIEIETALKHNALVIPVLVDDAAITREDLLPPSLRDLAFRNAAVVRHPDFRRDMARLIERIQAHPVRKARAKAPFRRAWWIGLGAAALAVMVVVLGVLLLVLRDGDDAPDVTTAPATHTIEAGPSATLPLTPATPDMTPTPGSPIGSGCQYASPVPPVVLGDLAAVTEWGVGLSMRETAGLETVLIRKLRAGDRMQLQGGPVCLDGYRWWQVQLEADGVTGWVADSDPTGAWLERIE